jgi:hypothetical protein
MWVIGILTLEMSAGMPKRPRSATSFQGSGIRKLSSPCLRFVSRQIHGTLAIIREADTVITVPERVRFVSAFEELLPVLAPLPSVSGLVKTPETYSVARRQVNDSHSND